MDVLQRAMHWAKQTAAFTFMLDTEGDPPKEVIEQIYIKATNVADRLMDQTTREFQGPRVLKEFTRKVLNWVAEQKKT